MKKWILIIFVCLSGCAYRSAQLLPPQTSEVPNLRDRYAVILLLDGARPQEIDEGVAEGYLPNFKRLFYEQGARFENALTVFPTVSTPAHQALLSGLQPGHHGIPNLDWFSRPLEKYIDYLNPKFWTWTNAFLFNFLQVTENSIGEDRPHLIFEALQGQPSLAVFETVNSGATEVVPGFPPIFTGFEGKFQGVYEAFDIKALEALMDRFKKLPTEELPRFTIVACYGMDLVNHYVHPKSERAKDLLRLYDRFLAEFTATLENRGLQDKTLLIVTSDHGQHDVGGGMVDLKAHLQGMGLKVDHGNPKKSQVVWGDHGTAFSNLYFKLGQDWSQRPTYSELQSYPAADGTKIDLISQLLRHPNIEWLVAPEGLWKTHLHRNGQHALLLRKQAGETLLFAYRPDPGDDPLEYRQDPLLHRWIENGEFHDEEAWLKATAHLPIPDAVVAIPQLFDDFRAGDLVLMTSKNTQFYDKRPSGHGSLWREDRHIPLLLHGSGIQPGPHPRARIIDVYPTLLAYLGLHPPALIDGRIRDSLFVEQDRRAYSSEGFPSAGPKLSREAWALQLKAQLASGKLSEIEGQKARILLDSLEAYQRAEASN